MSYFSLLKMQSGKDLFSSQHVKVETFWKLLVAFPDFQFSKEGEREKNRSNAALDREKIVACRRFYCYLF